MAETDTLVWTVSSPQASFEFPDATQPIDPHQAVRDNSHRLTGHMLISSDNARSTARNYDSAAALQTYAHEIGSPTEVLFACAPALPGRETSSNQPTDSYLGDKDMSVVNEVMTDILEDTYKRVAEGRPRILAISSGLAYLLADPTFAHEALEEVGGSFLERLSRVAGTDPTVDADQSTAPADNLFSDFQHGNLPYLPSLVGLPDRSAEDGQPVRMMDRRLARMVVRRSGLVFFTDEEILSKDIRNKSDSPHSLGNPRALGSDPFEGHYLAERILHVAQTECDGNMLLGLASYGLGLAATASILSTRTDRPMRFNYVKLLAEEHKGDQKMEGDIHPEDQPIFVDDLVFHGSSTREALGIVDKHGIIRPIVDLVYVFDRQLQHRGKFEGRSLEDEGYRVHSLITMEKQVQWMVERDAITSERLADLVTDYRMHDRHYLPAFARDEELAVGRDLR